VVSRARNSAVRRFGRTPRSERCATTSARSARAFETVRAPVSWLRARGDVAPGLVSERQVSHPAARLDRSRSRASHRARRRSRDVAPEPHAHRRVDGSRRSTAARGTRPRVRAVDARSVGVRRSAQARSSGLRSAPQPSPRRATLVSGSWRSIATRPRRTPRAAARRAHPSSRSGLRVLVPRPRAAAWTLVLAARIDGDRFTSRRNRRRSCPPRFDRAPPGARASGALSDTRPDSADEQLQRDGRSVVCPPHLALELGLPLLRSPRDTTRRPFQHRDLVRISLHPPDYCAANVARGFGAHHDQAGSHYAARRRLSAQ